MIHPRELIAKKPKAVSIEVSTKCTLNCIYCDRRSENSRDMSFEEFLKLKAELKKIPGIKRINICGIGESFLNKEIYRILEELKEYEISMVTSGTILIDFPRLDRFGNVDMLIFSIDATDEESIKNICGKNYNFAHLLTNLENYLQYKKKNNSKLATLLNTTVNPSNIEEIANIMEFARKYKFKGVNYSLEWGSEAFIIQNLEKLRGAFSDARKKAQKYGIYCHNPFRSFCCLNLDSIVCLTGVDGDFYPCGYALNQQYKVGNIYRESFDIIWENSLYDKFKQGKLCNSCYMLRMFDINAGRITLDNSRTRQAQHDVDSIKVGANID